VWRASYTRGLGELTRWAVDRWGYPMQARALPGKGDAVVMAWSEGNAAAVSRHHVWKWEKYRDRPQRWIV